MPHTSPPPQDVRSRDGTHCIYVVRLCPDVLNQKRFAEANPDRNPSKPCLYVGMTGLTPEARFENHKAGYKASRWVRDYGVELVPELYRPYNRMSYDAALRMESMLADRLRSEGYAVWQK